MKSLKKRRERLWIENDGICKYCGIKTILPEQNNLNYLPKNLATVDHLINKLEEKRQVPNHSNEIRSVLACRECNFIRGKLDEFRLIEKLILRYQYIL